MMHPTLFNTAEILYQKGVRHVVLSPGSRNAPLTISFARHPHLKLYNIVDERSAGFIALGIAQKSKSPVVLCCTSGTSLLNYAPAVAEAFYQQIPLIILSADRPPEWQEQRDGQTINQLGALSNFVKKTFQLPVDLRHKDTEQEFIRKLDSGVNLAAQSPNGPVHLNMPFREPFYPENDEILQYDNQVRLVKPVQPTSKMQWHELAESFDQYHKVLVVLGQQDPDEELVAALSQMPNIPVVCDVIANYQGHRAIQQHDLFLGQLSNDQLESLKPDLLITTGRSVVSKNLKMLLRKYSGFAHWHFDKAMLQADTYQSMTQLVQGELHDFLQAVNHGPVKNEFQNQKQSNFHTLWKSFDEKARNSLNKQMAAVEFGDFSAMHQVISALPSAIDLHLANSMVVRYANFIQQLSGQTEVFCNRGTSGIDGTNGTAVGNALISNKLTFLLTGDLSLFYDRNAFFHPHDFSSLRIVVFNNQGGGIFRLINGPAKLPELETHFETRHQRNASFLAAEFGFDYYVARDKEQIEAAMSHLNNKKGSPVLLEIFTNPETNDRVFSQVKQELQQELSNR